MKIRTQLIVALLLLAVVPLTGIVLYSYLSSRRAVRETVEAEAAALTGEMERRLGDVKSDLRERIDRLGGLSFAELAGEAPVAGNAEHVVVKRWLTELGDAAPLVDSFEVIPEPPRPPRPRPGSEPPTPAELESIILEVTREYEEMRDSAGPGDVGREITLGLQLGVDVATAVAEALAPLAAAPPAPRAPADLAGEEADEETDVEVTEEVAPEPWQRWLSHLKRTAEGQGRDEESGQMAEDRLAVVERRKQNALILGPEMGFPVRERGAAIGRVKPHLSAQKFLRRVFQQTRRDQGEVPFALDAEGRLYVAEEADRAVLENLPLRAEIAHAPLEDWVVVTRQDPETGLSFGIARPIRESLAAVEAAARRSLTYGLSAILLALVGVVGLSTRMTRRVEVLTNGAERIAAGDLQTRVPVRGRDELGQLAGSFNRMAGELSRSREQLFVQERQRRDQEVARQVLEADNARKTRELEEAREFQLSLLPKALPENGSYSLAVHMETATEVGGDYYDFRSGEDGTLIAAVGDATGHGARAGTMVTIIKSLFSAASPDFTPAGFLGDAARAIQRMDLGRMNMALLVAELRGHGLTVASAGMPPPLLHRATAADVEEITIEGMPLGTFDSSYHERRVELEAGDTLLLMSDGFPELPDAAGEPLGYARVRELFAGVASNEPAGIIDELAAAVSRWTDGGPPNDDVTFVVLRIR